MPQTIDTLHPGAIHYTLTTLSRDGRAEVLAFTSEAQRDLMYTQLRLYFGADRLALSNRATLAECRILAQDVWGASEVRVFPCVWED